MAHDLFEAARGAMAFAHAPYSKFPVGESIRADDGKIYTGANIENLSFPQGWCAEPSAISAMIMGGAKKITELAVIAEKLAVLLPKNLEFHELSVQLIEARPKLLSHRGDVLTTDFIHGPRDHWCAPQLPNSRTHWSGYTKYPQSTVRWIPP